MFTEIIYDDNIDDIMCYTYISCIIFHLINRGDTGDSLVNLSTVVDITQEKSSDYNPKGLGGVVHENVFLFLYCK